MWLVPDHFGSGFPSGKYAEGLESGGGAEMKISYRREIKHNYLIIDPEALIWRNYECRMLAGNQIDGILHFQLRQVDDEIRFY